jgi:hypothetical protein
LLVDRCGEDWIKKFVRYRGLLVDRCGEDWIKKFVRYIVHVAIVERTSA